MFKVDRTRDDDNARIDVTVTDGSIVSVWWLGAEYQPDDRAYRQRYGYAINNYDAEPNGNRWEYVGDDIFSGCGAEPNVSDAAETLFGFLGAAADAYRAGMSGRTSEHSDLFPAHVTEWAYMHDDDISMVTYELSDTTED